MSSFCGRPLACLRTALTSRSPTRFGRPPRPELASSGDQVPLDRFGPEHLAVGFIASVTPSVNIETVSPGSSATVTAS